MNTEIKMKEIWPEGGAMKGTWKGAGTLILISDTSVGKNAFDSFRDSLRTTVHEWYTPFMELDNVCVRFQILKGNKGNIPLYTPYTPVMPALNDDIYLLFTRVVKNDMGTYSGTGKLVSNVDAIRQFGDLLDECKISVESSMKHTWERFLDTKREFKI